MTNDAAVAYRFQDRLADGTWQDQYWHRLPPWEHRNPEPLYSATTVAELRAEVERLREALDALVQAASPMVTTDFRCQSITEPNSRGGQTNSVDPFPLMKFRPEDMRDLKHELERARAALTKESP